MNRLRKPTRTVWLAPLTFDLPDLQRLAAVSTAGPSLSRHYRETYFDTEGLDLLHLGATLFQTAESERIRWKIQLYRERGGNLIPQLEPAPVYEGRDPPDTFLRLLRGFHLDRPLAPIIEIAATEITTEFLDASGDHLGTLTDKSTKCEGQYVTTPVSRMLSISTSCSHKKALRFSEDLQDLLAGSGCTISSGAPEIFQIIGQEILTSEAEPPARSPSDPTIYQIFQSAFHKSLLRLLTYDVKVRISSEVEMVHEIRVAIRRMRSHLRSFNVVLDAKDGRSVRDELAWIGDEIGRTRDDDVLFGHVEALIARFDEQDRSAARDVLCAIEAERLASRRAMLIALNSDRYLELVGRLTDIATGAANIEDRSARLTKPALEVMQSIVRRRWRKFSNAAQKTDESSTAAQLHRVRILAKQCKYAADAAEPIFGKPARSLAANLTKVQNLLGEYHDGVVHESWLRHFAIVSPDSRVAIGQMIHMIREERIQLRREWPALFRKVSSKNRAGWLRNPLH